MTELELVKLYAKVWNTLKPELIESYLADDVVYESQQVFSSLDGKEVVFDYLKGKMQTIRDNIQQSKVYAEVGYSRSYRGYYIETKYEPEGRPCVVLAQGNPDEVVALVLLEIGEGKIKRIDIITVAPIPSSATRTGEYPS